MANNENSNSIKININYIGTNMELAIQPSTEVFVRAAVKEINQNYYEILNKVSTKYNSETILKKLLLEITTELKILQSFVGISKESYTSLVNLEKNLSKYLEQE